MSATFAFVFPGQGSQSVGMLDAWGGHPVLRDCLDEASEALGENLGALIASGPKEALGLTTNTQPVMLVAGVANYRIWLAEGGPKPAVLAGHSLGEYAALVAAGSLSLAQAVPLVRLRADAMQRAVPVGTGAMAAVLGMPSATIAQICQQVTDAMAQPGLELVEAVNFNDPLQTVIAGSKAAVDKACEAVKAAGAKRALLLPVSAPFHCSLMKPAALELQAALATTVFASPQIPVLNNIDVTTETVPAAIRDALYRQAFGPVRWVETIQALASMGIQTVVECGPGKVLAGMAKRIDATLAAYPLYDPVTLAELKSSLTGESV
jgi:[acyl-carrier-protein] S-malonyltransferase